MAFRRLPLCTSLQATDGTASAPAGDVAEGLEQPAKTAPKRKNLAPMRKVPLKLRIMAKCYIDLAEGSIAILVWVRGRPARPARTRRERSRHDQSTPSRNVGTPAK